MAAIKLGSINRAVKGTAGNVIKEKTEWISNNIPAVAFPIHQNALLYLLYFSENFSRIDGPAFT